MQIKKSTLGWAGNLLEPRLRRTGLLMAALFILPHLATAQDNRWEAPPLLEGAIKVTAEELLDLKAEFPDLVIIDTRPGDKAKPMKIEGAVTVTDQVLSPHTLSSLATGKSTPLVFFGADTHSIHSYRAAKTAVTLGYTYVFWFRGGLQEWLDKGMPVVGLKN